MSNQQIINEILSLKKRVDALEEQARAQHLAELFAPKWVAGIPATVLPPVNCD